MSGIPQCHVPRPRLCRINALEWLSINIPGRRNLLPLATSAQITKFHFASWIYTGIFSHSHFSPSLVSCGTFVFHKGSVILDTRLPFIHKTNAQWHSEISPLWPQRLKLQGRNLPAIMFSFSIEPTTKMQFCVLEAFFLSFQVNKDRNTIILYTPQKIALQNILFSYFKQEKKL